MNAKTLGYLYKGLYGLTIFSLLASAMLTVGARPTSAAQDTHKVGVCHANGNDTHIYIEVPPNEGGYPQGHYTENGTTEDGHEQDYLADSKEECDSAGSTPTSSSRTLNTATSTPAGTQSDTLTATPAGTLIDELPTKPKNNPPPTRTPTTTSAPTKTPTPTIIPTNTSTPTRTPTPTSTSTPTNTPTPSYGVSIIDSGTLLCSFFNFTISNSSEGGAVIPKVSWLVQPSDASGTIEPFDVAAVLNFGPASPGTYRLYVWIGDQANTDNADVSAQVTVSDTCSGTSAGVRGATFNPGIQGQLTIQGNQALPVNSGDPYKPENLGQLTRQGNPVPLVNNLIPVTGFFIPVTGLADNTSYLSAHLANLGFGALAMAVIVHGFALGKRKDKD